MNLTNTIFVTTQTITMEEIWKKLPNDIIRYILTLCDDLDIDLRLQFKIAPRRLPKSKLELSNKYINRYINQYGDIGVYIVFDNAKYFTYKTCNCVWYEWRFGVENAALSILPYRYLRYYEYKLN